MTVASDSTGDNARLTQYHWNGRNAEQWYFHPQDGDENNNTIENRNSIKLAGPLGKSTTDKAEIAQYHATTTTSTFQNWESTVKETFTLPSIETQPLPPVPSYTSISDQMPDETTPVVTAYTLAPFFSITDPKYVSNIQKQLEGNIYYLFYKKQYWKLVNSKVLAPSEKYTWNFTAGITETDLESITETVGVDAGFQYNFTVPGEQVPIASINLGLSVEWSREIQTAVSHSVETVQEETYGGEIINNNAFSIAWSQYILVTEYYIQRADGTLVTDPIVVTDSHRTQSVYYPDQQYILNGPVAIEIGPIKLSNNSK